MSTQTESEIIAIVLFQVSDGTPAGEENKGGIGFDGRLLYKGKEVEGDMPRFAELSRGGVVIMGEETYKGLKGHKLDNNRDIIVVSRKFKNELVKIEDGLYQYNNIYTVIDVTRRIFPGRMIVIAGGVPVYDILIPRSNRVYTTQVVGHRTADRKIKFSFEGFSEVGRVEIEREGIHYSFIDYKNISTSQFEAYENRGENGY